MASRCRWTPRPVLFAAFDATRPEHERAAAILDHEAMVISPLVITDLIFTLDQRDHRAITPLTPGLDAFRILPGDATS